MKRSFLSLSPQEALHVAIFIEERNAELYHRFAEMFVEFRDIESLEIAGVFWDMAVEEHHHSTRLQTLYSDRFGNSACAITEQDIEEMIELPKLEDGKVLSPSSSGVPPRERAMQVALKAEQNARQYYADIAEQTPDPKLHKFYKELAEFETDHVEFLERKLSEITAGNDRAS
jgi:rubrerythrin